MPFELFKGWKPSLRHVRIWGCTSEIRVYNPQEKKLDPRTISGYFVGYAERSKGYKFYCPSYHTRFVESRNAKFLENHLMSGRDQSQYSALEKDHSVNQPSISTSQVIVLSNTPQLSAEQQATQDPIATDNNQEVPQIVDNLVDLGIHGLPENIEQPVVQHAPQEIVDASLRRSTRIRRSTIPSD